MKILILVITVVMFLLADDKNKTIVEVDQAPEMIHGYILPPEPDEKINNSTLLGIDVNHNGVRDDVERKIIFEYTEPIQIEMMLVHARAHQNVLAEQLDEKDIQKIIQKVGDCNLYLMDFDLGIENFVEFTESNLYNTKERVRKYLNYNQALSGGVYGSGPADWNAGACDFDVERMLKER